MTCSKLSQPPPLCKSTSPLFLASHLPFLSSSSSLYLILYIYLDANVPWRACIVSGQLLHGWLVLPSTMSTRDGANMSRWAFAGISPDTRRLLHHPNPFQTTSYTERPILIYCTMDQSAKRPDLPLDSCPYRSFGRVIKCLYGQNHLFARYKADVVTLRTGDREGKIGWWS